MKAGEKNEVRQAAHMLSNQTIQNLTEPYCPSPLHTQGRVQRGAACRTLCPWDYSVPFFLACKYACQFSSPNAIIFEFS